MVAAGFRSPYLKYSSIVEHLLVVQWVIGSICHGGPNELFLVPSSAPQLCNKGCGMCYPVCGMVHIKELSLSGSLPYGRCHIAVNKMS